MRRIARRGRVATERAWSEATRAHFIAAWTGGATTAVIGERHGISQMAVSRIARRLGLAPRGRARRRAA